MNASDQAQAVERKLATIVSADVAGYSRLMAEDEEETVKTFRGHKAVFESLVGTHRGRVFNTAGDAILAEFGSAVEAVRCATEIQAALRTRNDQLSPSRRVEFRIGVNLGDVMLQGSDLLGDGVNVAARIQAGAPPGGICISGSVYDQIRNKLSLSFQAMGEKTYKNIPQPVRTYSIVESEDFGRLPAASAAGRSRLSVKLILAACAVLIAAGGYLGYRTYREREVARMQDGRYGGQVCLGPMRGDEARCYQASGISISGGRISAKYPAKVPGLSNVISGDVTPSGDVTMEVNIVNGEGGHLGTARLTGSLRNGQLIANGDGFRTFKIDWRRE
jgi:class 3 adenylate cyclase